MKASTLRMAFLLAVAASVGCHCLLL